MERLSPMAREYLTGSLASSFTAGVFNPLEVVKTRLQLQGMPGTPRLYTGGFVATLRTIAQQDGLALLWRHGLVTIVGRDFFYSGVRTGMYPTVRSVVSSGRAAEDVSMVQKIVAGAICGGVGAGLGNPFDVVRVRMIADGGVIDRSTGKLATGFRAGHEPRYRSSLQCFADARRSEGFLRGLCLRGIVPSMSRAALLTAAQMSTYDHTKVLAKRHGVLPEGVALHCIAAGISGFAAQVSCNPADVLKSRVMSARAGSANGAPVTVTSMAVHILRHEGVGAFYKGFAPAYARLGPTIFVQMPIVEALRKAMGVRSL